MARAPMPTSHPSVPPMTAPEPAPTLAPSGDFVSFSVTSSLELRFSGKSREISVLKKPSSRNAPIARRLRLCRWRTANSLGWFERE